jgi:hypothetical protein
LVHHIFPCFPQKVAPVLRYTLCVIHPILPDLVTRSFLLRLEHQLHLQTKEN